MEQGLLSVKTNMNEWMNRPRRRIAYLLLLGLLAMTMACSLSSLSKESEPIPQGEALIGAALQPTQMPVFSGSNAYT